MDSMTKYNRNLATTSNNEAAICVGGILGMFLIAKFPEICDAIGRNKLRFAMNVRNGSVEVGHDCVEHKES